MIFNIVNKFDNVLMKITGFRDQLHQSINQTLSIKLYSLSYMIHVKHEAAVHTK